MGWYCGNCAAAVISEDLVVESCGELSNRLNIAGIGYYYRKAAQLFQ